MEKILQYHGQDVLDQVNECIKNKICFMFFSGEHGRRKDISFFHFDEGLRMVYQKDFDVKYESLDGDIEQFKKRIEQAAEDHPNFAIFEHPEE